MPSGPICDFCSLPPGWLFPTRAFTAFIGDESRNFEGGWTVCPRCAELLEARDFDGLVTRCIDFMGKRFGNFHPHTQLYIVVRQFFCRIDANRIGPKEPWK